MKITKIITVIITFLLLSALCLAAEEKDLGDIKGVKAPIDITSDSLEATREKIIFIGNVHAVYGEMTVDAERIELTYDPDSKKENKKDNIKSMVAKGNVRLVEKQRKAWAENMVYEGETGMITLTGNPKIKQLDNIIAGDLIKMFVNDEKVTIEGSVKAVINPETIEEK